MGIVVSSVTFILCGESVYAQQTWTPKYSLTGYFSSVAAGDVNGDGAPDIIAGRGPAPTTLKIWNGFDGSPLDSVNVTASAYPCPGSELAQNPQFGASLKILGDVFGDAGVEFVVSLHN